jgi:peptidoglycan-N-acetylglucosamine deacetylase
MNPSVYLTFDDGPHPTHTPAILEVLGRHGAFATFFQEGRHVRDFPSLSKLVAYRGHAVGNHSWDHPRLDRVDCSEVRHQLSATSDEITRVTGRRPTLFRPPEGELGDEKQEREIRKEAAVLGMETVLWDVTSWDWQKPGRDAIFANVVESVAPGAVVLLHDGECADEKENVAAVDAILLELADCGYIFPSLASDASATPGTQRGDSAEPATS